MNLPNYFLADLPPEASLQPTLLTEACRAIKHNRERYLLSRSTHSVVLLLSTVARNWLQPEDSFRKLALELGPRALGFSSPTLASGLDKFFKQVTPERLQALIEQDLGHPNRLEHLARSAPEERTNRAALTLAPELLAHITAGNIPVPALQSIVRGLLLRSAQFVKCATGKSLLPRLFAHSLYDADHKVGACLELAEWPGGNAQLEAALFAEADCVTVTGSDETLAAIGQRLPRGTRLVGYGNRVSFGYIAAEVLSGFNAKKVAGRAAADIAAWDQLGCLSPHVIYVQDGGVISAGKFAELLADALAEHENMEPRGDIPVEISAAIASRRAIYEVRAADSPDTLLWSSRGSTAWTVVYESNPRFQLSCLHRFIYVKTVKDLTEALQGADSFRNKVSTVGLAVPEHLAENLALELARWGATRICPLGQMQNPPLGWRHDGRPALGELVRWADWETE